VDTEVSILIVVDLVATIRTIMLTGKIGKWDQFAANKQKFDVEASFDENVYTSRLNKEELGYENDPTRRAVGERD